MPPSISPPKHVWREGWDDNYKRHYYYNTLTEESSWEKPPSGYKPYVAGEESSSDEYDDDASSSSGSLGGDADKGDKSSSSMGLMDDSDESDGGRETKVEPKVLRYASPVPRSPDPGATSFLASSSVVESLSSSSSSSYVPPSADDRRGPAVDDGGGTDDGSAPGDGSASMEEVTGHEEDEEERRGVWEAGMRRPGPRPGQTRGDKESVHAREAAMVSMRFASNVQGDFVTRQMRDVKNRKRDHERLIEREEATGRAEREEALRLNAQTRRLLRENGTIGVRGEAWFDRLHKSRVNKMAQFLMGERDVAGGGRTQLHNPTFFTDKEGREELEEHARRGGKDSSRARTNTAEVALNPRRWKYLSNREEEVGEAIREDVLLSPQNKTGVRGHFFKTNELGDASTVEVRTTRGREATEEERLFVEAFERNIMEGEREGEREEKEVKRKFEKERRSSVVGVSLGHSGSQVSAATFFGHDAGHKFAENARIEEREGRKGQVLSLTPTKGKNNRGRRATTSGLLVEGICKHVNKAFEELEVEGGLDYEGFARVMEKMAFLNDEKRDDVRLMGRAWGVYSIRGKVGLEACQRLFVQVLGGLEVNDSFGEGSQIDPEEEKKVIGALCVVHNERRLCRKPKHWREGSMREGLLYNKEKKAAGPHTQGKVSAVSVKKKKGRAGRGGAGHMPSDHVRAAVGSLKGRTRRRASTFTTRLRKERTKGGKSKLEEWYKCTFKPEINEYSKKLDGKKWKRELEQAKAKKARDMTAEGGGKAGGGSERILIRDAYEDVVHFLEKVIDAGGRKANISKLDVEHAFDELKEDEDHMEEAKKGEEMLLSCMEGQQDGVRAQEVMNSLEDRYGGMAMEEEEFGGGGVSGVPETLRVRLDKWKVFEMKKRKVIEAKKLVKDKEEMKGCTFKPKLNRTTKKITEGKKTEGTRTGKVEGRLYEEGMRKETIKRNKHKHKLERQGTEMMEREERELKEHCTFKPNLGRREEKGEDVKLEEVGGMREWMFWNEMAKMKKEEEKEREGKMKFRKTGEHLFEKWDPSMKFAKPFEFKHLEKRGLEEKRFRKTSRMKESDDRKKQERMKEKAGLRKSAQKVHKEAKREDWMIKRLNAHVGPPLFVLELKTGEGLIEALYVWKGDDLEEIANQYGAARELSEEGQKELLEVMRLNYEAMIGEVEVEVEVEVEGEGEREEEVEAEVEAEEGEEGGGEDKGELTVEEL
ncbi:hypothetical protein TrRE_jg6389 [Triparma retinervis]|uniref:WW domain-containing protein n=1 Tax=Triparma retinervis TaxID=2557542 RepID=A0A9W7C8N1_9STRA|nr:hypothetical protein TrRE_jg6389 [Triparma retinervis]